MPECVCRAWCARASIGGYVIGAVQRVGMGVAMVFVTAKSGLRFVLIEIFVSIFPSNEKAPFRFSNEKAPFWLTLVSDCPIKFPNWQLVGSWPPAAPALARAG